MTEPTNDDLPQESTVKIFHPHLPAHSDSELARYAELLREAKSIQGVSLGRSAWRRLRRNRIAMPALSFLVFISLVALLAPLLPLAPPRKINLDSKFAAPVTSPLWIENEALPKVLSDDSRALLDQGFGDLGPVGTQLLHWRIKLFGRTTLNCVCGTDQLGRDMLARLVWGARISLAVGLVATLVSLAIGVSYGAIAGYVGGWVDNAMMRVVDMLYSIPFIFVVIFIISVLSDPYFKTRLADRGIDRIFVFFFLVGAIYWLTMSRVVRGQIISLKQNQFVEAARVIGASQLRIIFRHLVPNLLSVVIVYLTLTIPNVMLFEAFLSFLGLGVEPPDVSWGLLANEGVKVITPIQIYWWLVAFPSLALGLTLFSLNFLGDGLRDALDPRLKNR